MSAEMRPPWEELERPGPDVVEVGGAEVRAGSRVILRPRAGGDVFDLVLAGRAAVVEALETDYEGTVKLAVVVEDDPGRDLGEARQPGHRFFFDPEEVEPAPAAPAAAGPRMLVAGIGNVFLGDDGFGSALAGELARRDRGEGVDVVDYGIRGMDLAYALGDYDAAILCDAVPRGEAPGTLYVIEPDVGDERVGLDAHGMDPVKVLALARELGGVPDRILVVGCEPHTVLDPESEEIVAELTEPVRAAIPAAVGLVESHLDRLANEINDGREVAPR